MYLHVCVDSCRLTRLSSAECSFLRSSSVSFRLPQWLSGKEPTHNAGDGGLIPGLGRSPGEGKGNLCGSVVKNLPANARDTGSIPESGRSTGVGTGNPLQYSCLENTDRGAHGLQFMGSQSRTRLRDWAHTNVISFLRYIRRWFVDQSSYGAVLILINFGLSDKYWAKWLGRSFPMLIWDFTIMYVFLNNWFWDKYKQVQFLGRALVQTLWNSNRN